MRVAKPPFAALLFGYDVFISFALGASPRGSLSYASDLARRLRERDFTVFFSEDEAPAGGRLDATLKTALKRSRVLVVIANRGTLAEPRWVQVEVEEFRRLHPEHPVIPINIGGALQDTALGTAAADWLPWADRIWIDDTQEACDQGVVGEAAIERLLTAPKTVRTGTRWRWTVRAAFATLALLTAAAAWFAVANGRNARLARSNEQTAQRNEVRATANAATARRNEALAATNAAEAASEAVRAQHAEGDALREADLARQAERRARAGELASRSRLEHGSDAVRALLLAREAWQTAPASDARLALYEALNEPVQIALSSAVGHGGRVAYSSDNRRIAIGGAGFALLSTEATSKPVAVNTTDMASQSLVFSPDGKRLATLWAKASVQLWDADTGAPVSASVEIPGLSYAWSLAWRPDGAQVAMAGTTPSSQQVIVFWDPSTQRESAPRLSVGGLQGKFDAAYSPDGTRVAATAYDHVEVWDLERRVKVVHDIPTPTVPSFVVFTDDLHVVFNGPGYEATAWNLSDNRAEEPTYGGHANWVTSFAHSASGGVSATGSDDGTIRLWRAGVALPLSAPLVGHTYGVESLAFNGDGTELLSAGRDGRLIRWLLPTDARRLRKAAPMADPRRDGADVTQSIDLGWTVRLLRNERRLEWQHAGRSQMVDLQGDAAEEGLAVAANGTLALRGTSDKVGLLEAGRGEPRCSLDRPARGARFSADSRRLFTWYLEAARPVLRVWSVSDCRPMAVLERQEADADVLGVDWAADGQALWMSGGQTLRRWDVAQRTFVGPAWPVPDTPVVVADPLGRYVGTALPDGGVRLFDLKRGGAATDLLGGHGKESVLALAFSADGLWLASAANGSHVLWDLATGQQAGRAIRNRQGQLRQISFSADSRTLMTTSTDGPDQYWQLDPEAWAEQACVAAHRNLTCGEWRRFLGPSTPYRRTCPQWPAASDAATCSGK